MTPEWILFAISLFHNLYLILPFNWLLAFVSQVTYASLVNLAYMEATVQQSDPGLISSAHVLPITLVSTVDSR